MISEHNCCKKMTLACLESIHSDINNLCGASIVQPCQLCVKQMLGSDTQITTIFTALLLR